MSNSPAREAIGQSCRPWTSRKIAIADKNEKNSGIPSSVSFKEEITQRSRSCGSKYFNPSCGRHQPRLPANAVVKSAIMPSFTLGL